MVILKGWMKQVGKGIYGSEVSVKQAEMILHKVTRYGEEALHGSVK